ncbi:unnamed protein product [marine sediment metagenome]|uniref:Uncharacterized protein n=1 Tax=marine sediment metagenome TaxID=412755 RepID=X0X0D7_9ZZZZ
MTKKEKAIISQAIKEIENWSGEAYYTPETDPEQCPDGNEIYQALEKIKEVIK